MIVQKIIEMFFGIAQGLLGMLPDLSFTVDISGYMQGIANIFHGVNYIIPLNSVLPILIISFAITGFRIIYALVLRIKSFIPGMGG